MPPVIGTATSSDWSSGGALLTFFFPIVLFVVIAAALYLRLSRPHTVPGLKPLTPAATVPRTAPSGPKATDMGTAGPADDAANAVSPPADDAG
jgi:hypothetical protein